MTLKARLIIVTIAILTLIGVGIGTSAALSVRASLLNELDAQLEAMGELAAHGPGGFNVSDSNPPPAPEELRQSNPQQDVKRFLSAPGRSDGALAAVVADGKVTGQVTRAEEGAPVDISSADLDPLRNAAGLKYATTVNLENLGSYRVIASPLRENAGIVIVGLPQASADAAMRQTLISTSAAVIVGVFAAGLVATWIITRQMRPLEQVAATAAEVSELDLETGNSKLTVRIPDDLIRRGTEVGKVGRAMNLMLEHVDDALGARYNSEQQVRRFVADASHELRTPLAAIRGYADLTKPARRELPALVQQSLGKIDSGAQRMSSLVEDLLLLARLDADEEEIGSGDVDLSAALIETVEAAHITAPDHVFDIQLPAEPLTVRGHETRVVQVLTNVIANAGMHTPAGTRVRVEARAQANADSGAAGSGPWVIVSIADDGPGIDPEVRDRVFDRFVRASGSRARGERAQTLGGSSGLGLAITHSLMSAMGGSVSVDSRTPGEDAGWHGTVFTLQFQQATAET